MGALTFNLELTPYKVQRLKLFIRKRFGFAATDENLHTFLQERPDIIVSIHESIDPANMDTFDRDGLVDGLTQYLLGKGRYWPTNSDTLSKFDTKQFIQELFAMSEAKGWKVAKLKPRTKAKKKSKK